MSSAGTGVLVELLRAPEGLRNGKAIVLLIGGFIVASFLLALAARVGWSSISWGALLGLLAMLCGFFAVSAAGVVLMDAVRGRESIPYGSAVLLGSFAFLKLVVGVIGLLLALLAVHLIVGAVLYICKIPGLGPVLFAFVLPVLLLVVALVYLGVGAFILLLAPALWEGNSLGSAIARVYAVASSRPIQFIITWVVASFLLGVVGLIVFGVLSSATIGVGTLSVSILGTDLGSRGSGAVFGFGGPFSRGSGSWSGVENVGGGYVVGGLFGVAAAWAIASAAFGAVAIMAMCIVYVGLSEGLDAQGAERFISDQVMRAKHRAVEIKDAAKQRAVEARARAQEAQERARQSSHQTESGSVNMSSSSSPAPGTSCAACGSLAEAGQAFCSECGRKLEP